MTTRRALRPAALVAAIFLLSTASLNAQDVIISGTANWDYYHPLNGVDPAIMDADFDTTWMFYSGYNGPAFVADKAAPFSYGGISYFTTSGLGGTNIGTPPSGSRYSAYIKKRFNATQGYIEAHALVLADDGAVIYLDGFEVGRVNMANSNGDNYMMFADDVGNTEVGPLIDVNLGPISAGDHVIAVSMHNADTASSDLGIYIEVFGSSPPPPPPPVMLRTGFGGVMTNVLADTPLPATGWTTDSPPLSFALIGGGLSTLHSAPVDLSTIGEVYFSAQVFLYEGSTGSNFEAIDSFGAKLEVTRDDNTTFDINLIPAARDTDGDGVLTGEEMNSSAVAVTEVAFLGLQLSAVIPADAKSVQVLLTGTNDSTSEEFDIGGMLISDVPPGSDADGDGMPREAELFAQTDPNDPSSVLRINGIIRTINTGTGEIDYTLTHPGVINMWYTIEYSIDGTTWNLFDFTRPTATNPNRAFTLSLTAAEDPGERLLLRMRAVP